MFGELAATQFRAIITIYPNIVMVQAPLLVNQCRDHLPHVNEIVYVADFAEILFPGFSESRQRCMLKELRQRFADEAPLHMWVESRVDLYSLSRMRLSGLFKEATGSVILNKANVATHGSQLKIIGNTRLWDELLTTDTYSDVYAGVELLNTFVLNPKTGYYRFLIQGVERMILAHCVLHRRLTGEVSSFSDLVAELNTLWSGLPESIVRARLNDRRHRLLRTVNESVPDNVAKIRLLLGLAAEL